MVVGTLGVIYNEGDVDTKEVLTAKNVGETGLARAMQDAKWQGTDQPVLHDADGGVVDGIFRPMLSMRFDAGGYSPRNAQLELAGVHVHLHDVAGLCGRISGISDRSSLFIRSGAMDWQLPLAGIAIVAAAVYVGRRAWRTWTHKGSGCGGGCGSGCKSAAPSTSNTPARLIPADQLTVRRREVENGRATYL